MLGDGPPSYLESDVEDLVEEEDGLGPVPDYVEIPSTVTKTPALPSSSTRGTTAPGPGPATAPGPGPAATSKPSSAAIVAKAHPSSTSSTQLFGSGRVLVDGREQLVAFDGTAVAHQ